MKKLLNKINYKLNNKKKVKINFYIFPIAIKF